VAFIELLANFSRLPFRRRQRDQYVSNRIPTAAHWTTPAAVITPPKANTSLHDEVWPDQIPTKHLEHLCAAEGHQALRVGMLPSQSENKSPRAADAIKQTTNKHSLTVLKFDGVGEPVHRLPQCTGSNPNHP
jgi:hypothetical protein